MATAIATRTSAAARCAACVPQARSRSAIVVQAKPKGQLDASGFVQADNSGKSNIFPTQQKAFYSSPTSDAAAREGLGGGQGAAVLAGALAVVAAATVLVLSSGSGETLSTLQSGDVQSLSAIAGRIAASL